MLLAALCLLPGISLFAGLVLTIPAMQMAAGFRAPLLPRFLRQRQIEIVRLRALGDTAIPWIEKTERFVRPRWLILTLPPMPTIVGILVIGLALVVIIPLPFSNLPPAISLLCLALGLFERDGLVILIGLIAAAIALTIGVLITYVAVEGATLFLGKGLG